MSGGSEQHRLEFAPSDRFHVFVRLLPQARQALLQAYSSQQPCSLQYSTDGAPHELKVGDLVFPFETQKEEKTCEVVQLPDEGQLAPAVELGRITERAHVKPCLDDAQRKRTRERVVEAEKDRRARKMQVLDASKGSGPSSGANKAPTKRRVTPPPRPQSKPRAPTPAAEPPRQQAEQARAAAEQLRPASRPPSVAPRTSPSPAPRGPTPPTGRSGTPALPKAKKVSDFGKGRAASASTASMAAPPIAVHAAKQGKLRACLLGILLDGPKLKFKHVQQMVADAASKAPELRLPTPEALTAALKDVALFKAPGFYLLGDPEGPPVAQDIARLKEEWERAKGTPAPQDTESDDVTPSVSRTASLEIAGSKGQSPRKQQRSLSPQPRHKARQKSPPPGGRTRAPAPAAKPAPPAAAAASPSKPAARRQAQILEESEEEEPEWEAAPDGKEASPEAARPSAHGGSGGSSSGADAHKAGSAQGAAHRKPGSVAARVPSPKPAGSSPPASRDAPSPSPRPSWPGLSSSSSDTSTNDWLRQYLAAAKKGRPGRPSEEASGSLPQAADRRICSWEQFEACRLEYDDKFGRLAALQQLCTKFDRQLSALQQAKQSAQAAGDAAAEDRWGRQLAHMTQQKQPLAADGLQAYNHLRQDLSSLHKAMTAFWRQHDPQPS